MQVGLNLGCAIENSKIEIKERKIDITENNQISLSLDLCENTEDNANA